MATEEVAAPPLTLRQLALECYREGDYPHAEQLLRRVLKMDFELPGSHYHLARVPLLMDRDQEALPEVTLAWEHRAEVHVTFRSGFISSRLIPRFSTAPRRQNYCKT